LPRVTRGLLVAMLAALPASALAEGRGPFSIRGGRLIGHGEDAISAGAGWPSAYFQYDTGVSSSFDLGLRGEFFWGSPTTSHGRLLATHLGAGLSAPLRLALSESRRIGIALGLRPGLYAGGFTGSRGARFGDDATGFGVQVAPGALVTIAASDRLNVVAGAELPVLFLFVPDADVEVFLPIVPFVGLEIGLADDLEATVLGAFGPGLHVHEPAAGIETAIQVAVGIAYLQ
jgi:hypothetical protein